MQAGPGPGLVPRAAVAFTRFTRDDYRQADHLKAAYGILKQHDDNLSIIEWHLQTAEKLEHLRTALDESSTVNDPRGIKAALEELDAVLDAAQHRRIPLDHLNTELQTRIEAVLQRVERSLLYIWDRFFTNTPNIYKDLLLLLPTRSSADSLDVPVGGGARTFAEALPALQFPALLLRLARTGDRLRASLTHKAETSGMTGQMVRATHDTLLQSWYSATCSGVQAELQALCRSADVEARELPRKYMLALQQPLRQLNVLCILFFHPGGPDTDVNLPVSALLLKFADKRGVAVPLPDVPDSAITALLTGALERMRSEILVTLKSHLSSDSFKDARDLQKLQLSMGWLHAIASGPLSDLSAPFLLLGSARVAEALKPFEDIVVFLASVILSVPPVVAQKHFTDSIWRSEQDQEVEMRLLALLESLSTVAYFDAADKSKLELLLLNAIKSAKEPGQFTLLRQLQRHLQARSIRTSRVLEELVMQQLGNTIQRVENGDGAAVGSPKPQNKPLPV